MINHINVATKVHYLKFLFVATNKWRVRMQKETKSAVIRGRATETQKKQLEAWASEIGEDKTKYMLEGIALRHEFMKEIPIDNMPKKFGNYISPDLGDIELELESALKYANELMVRADYPDAVRGQKAEKEFYIQIIKWLLECVRNSGNQGDKNRKRIYL